MYQTRWCSVLLPFSRSATSSAAMRSQQLLWSWHHLNWIGFTSFERSSLTLEPVLIAHCLASMRSSISDDPFNSLDHPTASAPRLRSPATSQLSRSPGAAQADSMHSTKCSQSLPGLTNCQLCAAYWLDKDCSTEPLRCIQPCQLVKEARTLTMQTRQIPVHIWCQCWMVTAQTRTLTTSSAVSMM